MKTAMQELKDKIQHAIEQLNDELNEYKAGYKQCLINIQNDIDSQMLEMEKEQKEKVNLLLNTLLENNMCSVAGDELIKQFKKK